MRTARDKSNGPFVCSAAQSAWRCVDALARLCEKKNVKSEMRKRCIGGEEKLVVERDGG